jgi:acetyl-CoA carboxylase biotin carboxyl carrier protein
VNFKEILQLIDKVADRGIAALEIEQAGVKIRIEGKNNTPRVIPAYVSDLKPDGGLLPAMPMATLPAAPQPGAPPAAPSEAESEAGLHVITSPIVGTFYRAPNPESESFVNVGDHIGKGKVLCVIEAMKLMNEIESDVDGAVMKIYPQNGQPVEYGEKLFAVKM